MSEARKSPLLQDMLEAGGVVSEYHGLGVIRHFGDPAGEYAAATTSLAVFDRSHRARLAVSGRAPRQMLNGILTGTLPGPSTKLDDEVFGGRATYHSVLTPKGRMITDLWVMLRGDEESVGFLLDVPVAGHQPLLENFGKFIPPRFATVADVSVETAMITVVGPAAPDALSRLVLGLRVEADTLLGTSEGEWWLAGELDTGLAVVRSADVWPDAYSVFGPPGAVVAAWKRLVEDEAVPAGLGVWSTLRVEAGRPLFGKDMDDRTIPVEAGIDDRAIDHQKGCYTGQEIIVRIRDRGHVNRHLRRLELGDVPTPASGTELYGTDESGKVVGHVTSAVQSPKYGGVLALAYVRRGVETVTLDGREIAVPEE